MIAALLAAALSAGLLLFLVKSAARRRRDEMDDSCDFNDWRGDRRTIDDHVDIDYQPDELQQ